jgi:peptidoglycan-associated lipoprotein
MTRSALIAARPALTLACALALGGALAACAHKTPEMGDRGGPSAPSSMGDRGGGAPSTYGSTGVTGSGSGYAGGYRPGSPEEFAANEGDRVFFDYDQYTIRADARPVLEKQVAWLQRYPNVQVRVEGNADERGTREYNLALAERRASAVREFYAERGINPARMSTISYGKERPIDTSGTEAGMARNRNAHTAIVSGAS